MINIKGKEYAYDENEVINFTEGLVGLPEMRKAVLIPMDEFAPFCWLASVEDDKNRFIVVDPRDIYTEYAPIANPAGTKTMAIVKISSDWRKTTVNLRAPIHIDPAGRAKQSVLTDSTYSLAEAIPQN